MRTSFRALENRRRNTQFFGQKRSRAFQVGLDMLTGFAQYREDDRKRFGSRAFEVCLSCEIKFSKTRQALSGCQVRAPSCSSAAEKYGSQTAHASTAPDWNAARASGG